MKTRLSVPAPAKFVIIAVILMVLVDHFVFAGKEPDFGQAERHRAVIDAAKEAGRPPPVVVKPEDGKEFFEAPKELVVPPSKEDVKPEPEKKTEVIPPPAAPQMLPQKTEPKIDVPLARPEVSGRPKIAIIIDDVGMDLKHSHEAIDALPSSVTLAFLPYAPSTRKLAAQAKEKGHTLIIHVPMEAVDKRLNIGPGGLHEGMSESDFRDAFNVMLKSFDGYDGINNHMGSRLTQDADAMNRLMQMLVAHKLFFVDSKTIGTSVAWKEASVNGVRYAERDVFLDDDESLASVERQLRQTEALAKRRGYAVAIGHPKGNTLAALRAWIPTLKDKGIELVSVKTLLAKPSFASTSIPAKAGTQSGHEDKTSKSITSGAMDPHFRGDANDDGRGSKEVFAPAVEPATTKAPMVEKLPAPSVDMFPGEEGMVPNATWPSEESSAEGAATPSAPATGEPEIKLDPLPEESPSP